jgi:hypothetical protein
LAPSMASGLPPSLRPSFGVAQPQGYDKGSHYGLVCSAAEIASNVLMRLE